MQRCKRPMTMRLSAKLLASLLDTFRTSLYASSCEKQVHHLCLLANSVLSAPRICFSSVLQNIPCPFTDVSTCYHAVTKPPLINRGYYARHKSIASLREQFMLASKAGGAPCQVLSLGAGYDTTYFQLKSEVRGHGIVPLNSCVDAVN